MSSNHTRVSAREWSEMQQRIANTNAYVINRAEEARRIRAEAERRSREIAAAHEANMRAINQAVNTLSNAYQTTLQDVRGQFASQIAAHSSDFRGQLQGMLDDVRSVSGRISRSDSRVDALARQYNDAFQARLAQSAQGKERAQMVLQELDNFLQQIQALSPERFMPGDYASLQALRASIVANIQAGDYQAATVVSQNSILTAARVLTQLTLANESYNQQLAEARTAAATVANRVEELSSSAGVLSVEVGGEQQEYEYDIAYWSNGGFDVLRDRLNAAEARLTSGRLSMQELTQTQNEIAQIQAQLEHCDQRARRSMAGSVFVEDTAVRLHNSLTERGWELEEGGHHDDEAKEPYTLQYSDGNGNTVSIVVSPGDRTDEPIYAVEVFSEDEYRASIIKEGIHSSMAEEGLQIEGIERRDDCHLNPTPEVFRQNMVEEAQRRQQQHQ